jgi:hypothetical protein
MEKAMRTIGNSPAARTDAGDVDLAVTDTRPGRVTGAAFGGCPGDPMSTGEAPGFGRNGRRTTPRPDSGNVKVSLSDAVQITFATVACTEDPPEA